MTSKIKPLALAQPKPGPSLTFSDGLNFGCGFWAAGALFSIFAVPAAVIAITMLGALLGGLGR